ncbi:MAG: phosphoribosylamine--glycine ligase [Thermoplasmata archaeon]|nr:phosphoribosylamine--glycine ligase [Thermoplasmata archaeon]
MKVLVVGGGAREHAIVEALDKDDAELYVVMKNRNPGIARLCRDILYIPETEVEKIVDWASGIGIEMAIIGPEGPLEAGLVDELREVGIPCVGPTKDLAKLETSKSFTRGLFEKYDIPGNAKYAAFHNMEGVREWLEKLGEYVIKDDGLCGGKGVKLSGEHLATIDDGVAYAEECIRKHGAVVIEEKFIGEEFSLQALSDGFTVIGSPLAQDHKRAYEGDTGPNTGGMGSYSDNDHSLPFLRESDYEEALAITQKTCDALREECGEPYKGVMYGGFIATKDGVKCVEFNARFGDPEAMNVLPILESSFLKICQAIVDGTLRPEMADYMKKATVCKYIVPKGYGVKSLAGAEITLDEDHIKTVGARLYYASVNEENGKVYTTSSRSLAVIGIADDIAEAERVCESALESIKGEVFMRHDIGTPDAIEKRIKRMRGIRG